MISLQIDFTINPDGVDDFIAATVANAEKTTREPGNLRFELFRHRDDPNRFTLFEIFDSEEALAAHGASDYVAVWRAVAAKVVIEKTSTSLKPTYFAREQWQD